MSDGRVPHSAADFDVRRAYLWNPDFLLLMAQRWGLERIASVLDVGCGVGHWTAALLPLLPKNATILGIDREPAWVELATSVAERTGRLGRTTFRQGDACALDLDGETFDLVTCQTLLVHVADPAACLREMLRVLRPGGLLVAVEPNNVIQTLIATSTTGDDDPETVLARVRFQLLCERGRKKLGEGDISVGDRVPQLLGELGMQDIQVYVSDKASALVPPYASDEQRALTAHLFDGPPAGQWLFPRDDTRRYFLAGGGAEGAFEAGWQAVIATDPARDREAYRRGVYARAGGRLLYVVSGRKPRD